MTTLPLFPLGTNLLPDGRLALQVFERRYLDLVRDSLRDSSPFGIVWIRRGREVLDPAHPEHNALDLAEVGVAARIVDWDSLPNGLLGIVVEGGDRFSVLASRCEDNGLWQADIEYWQPEPRLPLPPQCDDMLSLLQQLGRHPHVQRTGLSLEVSDAAALGYRLAQLLPIPEPARYELLTAVDPVARLNRLHDILAELSE